MLPLSRLTLTFAAGFIDTATFLHLTGIFAAHVTGNIVIFAVELARDFQVIDLVKLLAIPIFALGVVAAARLHGPPRTGLAATRAFARLMRAECALMLALGFAALFDQNVDPAQNGVFDYLIGMGLVAAMGIQNAMHRLVPGPVTTVMTGHLSQVLITAVLRRRERDANAPRLFSFRARWMIVIFVVGCIASAYLTLQIGLASALLPGAGLLAAVLGEHLRRGRPWMTVTER